LSTASAIKRFQILLILEDYATINAYIFDPPWMSNISLCPKCCRELMGIIKLLKLKYIQYIQCILIQEDFINSGKATINRPDPPG